MKGAKVTPIQILTEVRDLFQDRSKWTRGVHARNRNHVPVEPWNRHAVCWCLDGALALKAGMKDWNETTNVYDALEADYSLAITRVQNQRHDCHWKDRAGALRKVEEAARILAEYLEKNG